MPDRVCQIFSVEGAGYAMPPGARTPAGETSKNLDTGAAAASKVGGRLGGMFGMGTLMMMRQAKRADRLEAMSAR